MDYTRAIVHTGETEHGSLLPDEPRPLTPREQEVLTLLVAGHRNKEIADRLCVSAKTVMHHTSAIYRKLGVRGRAEAILAAVRRGLAPPT